MTEHTNEKLATALGKIPGVPDEMIRRASVGYYHDYMSPLVFPEIQLVSDLRELAHIPATPRDSRQQLYKLAERVIGGDFDATPEESDAWAKSPEGQDVLRKLFGR